MMKHDINMGLVIALKDLYPELKDDLYRFNRRGKMEDIPEMGDLVLTGEDWENPSCGGMQKLLETGGMVL